MKCFLNLLKLNKFVLGDKAVEVTAMQRSDYFQADLYRVAEQVKTRNGVSGLGDDAPVIFSLDAGKTDNAKCLRKIFEMLKKKNPKIHFQKSKIKFDYCARISFRDHQIFIQRHQKSRYLY